MAQWRKVIVSGSTAELNHISSSGNLVPTITDGGSLGDISLNWSDLFLDSGAVINFDGGDVTATHTSNLITITGGNVRVDKLEIDSANDHIDVSTDLKLVSAQDIVLDPGGNNVKPGSDSADDLGVSGTAWRKLFVDDIDFAAQGGIVGAVHVSASSFNASTHITASGDLYVANDGYVGGKFEAVGAITASAYTGSFAGDGTNLTGITATSLDIDAFGSDLTSATLAHSDLILVSDGGTDGRANIGDLATPLAGDGLAASSNTIALDLNELTAADVNVANDSIAIIDADDNSSKKESVADFVDAINGTGIAAGSGQLSVAAAQTTIESIYNTSLKIGRSSTDTYIDFGTDDSVKISSANTVRLNTDTAGVHVTGTLDVSGNATIEGDLVVNGDTTTLSTTNLAVGDQFIFTATGSAASNVDGGLIVQSGSAVDSGSAIYHDIDSNRWSVAKQVKAADTAITPLEFVVTAKALGDNDAPVEDDKEYGVGEMAINDDGSIWIYS